jgi:hypothetical protein
LHGDEVWTGSIAPDVTGIVTTVVFVVLISIDVVVLGIHAFRDVGAGLLSGIFLGSAVAVKMAGGDNSFVSIVFGVV